MDFITILNKLQQLQLPPLTESVGLANRKPGETFANPAGDLVSFVSLAFYPDEGKYKDLADLDAYVSHLESKGGQIEFTNAKSGKTGGFGVATFKDTNGQILRYGRYFDKINSIFTGNFWPNNALPNGLRFNSKSSVKVSSGMMPQDVLTSFTDLTPADILKQVVEKYGPTHPLTHITNAVSKGQPLPMFIDTVTHLEINFEAFRDYFCEILQPMAVLNGTTTGNADEAASVFFGRSGFKGATITFNTGKNDGLADSLIVKNGKQIKLSSKGGAGAAASVKNLTDAVKELDLTGHSDLKNQYKDIIEIIELAQKSGQSEAPVVLGERFGLISGKEANIIRSMKTKKTVSLTGNLKKMYNERASGVDQEKLVPFYNMLAALAFKVAEYINENTNFSEGAATILNNGALVQVYTKARQEEGRIVLEQFTAKYPSTLVSGVEFNAGKTYYSSGIKGNFTFRLVSAASDPRPSSPAPAPVKTIAKRVDIRPKRAQTTKIDTKKGSTREKR